MIISCFLNRGANVGIIFGISKGWIPKLIVSLPEQCYLNLINLDFDVSQNEHFASGTGTS